jgi:hypothetical protein
VDKIRVRKIRINQYGRNIHDDEAIRDLLEANFRNLPMKEKNLYKDVFKSCYYRYGVTKLGRVFNVHFKTVDTWRRKLGILPKRKSALDSSQKALLCNKDLLIRWHCSESSPLGRPMHIKEIAGVVGCSPTTVTKYLGEENIRSQREAYNLHLRLTYSLPLDDNAEQVLTGTMLGDGNLSRAFPEDDIRKDGKKRNASKTARLCVVQCWRRRSYLVDFYPPFFERLGYKWQIFDGWTTHYRNPNKMLRQSSFITNSSYEFGEKEQEWYRRATNDDYKQGLSQRFKKIKIIPSSLKNLTPLICRIWYVEDGSYASNYNKSGLRLAGTLNSLKLSTQGFTPCENQYLAELLLCTLDLSKGIWVNRRNEISFHSSPAKKFIGFIGECPHSAFKYKFYNL